MTFENDAPPQSAEVIKPQVNASPTLIFRQSISLQIRPRVHCRTLLTGSVMDRRAAGGYRIVRVAAKYTYDVDPR